MTKCKSCKFYEVIKEFGDAFCKNKKNPFERILTKKFNNFGCSLGERADGLKECCETCKHYSNNCGTVGCSKGIIHIYDDSTFDVAKMRCDEHEWREA